MKTFFKVLAIAFMFPLWLIIFPAIITSFLVYIKLEDIDVDYLEIVGVVVLGLIATTLHTLALISFL